ncbi:MAG: hypothetical protein AAB525_04240 [Patescibacteria group bacterium]
MQDTFAQSEQASAPYADTRLEIQQRRQEIKNLRESDKSGTRQQRIVLKGQNVLDRIDLRLNRTVKLTDKIEEVAKKMQEKGTDAEAVLTLIDAARGKITEAQTSYEQSKEMLDAINGAEDLSIAIKNFKNAVSATYKSMSEVKTNLVEAIKTLKAIKTTTVN